MIYDEILWSVTVLERLYGGLREFLISNFDLYLPLRGQHLFRID